MKHSAISVYIRLLNQKEKLGKQWEQYSLKCNLFNKKILIKLSECGYIDNLKFMKNYAYFRPQNCEEYKAFMPVAVNLKNIKKIKEQYVKSNKYANLIVTTSKGLCTLDECFESKKGGYLIARVIKKIL